VLIVGPDSGLAEALSQNVVADIGRIPARRADAAAKILETLTTIAPSEARQELERRAARTPRVLAEQLARVYGREFKQPNYIAAMAVISRLRLGEQADVASLLEPYLTGTIDSFAKPSQSSLASHMLFGEVARRMGDERAQRATSRSCRRSCCDLMACIATRRRARQRGDAAMRSPRSARR
jgi:hypothetical protein